MKKIAIIGTGIAGMASGHLLHPSYDLTIYEKNNYVGGHSNTVDVTEDGQSIPIDTGFIVYNEVTYPELTQLFKRLKVPTQESSMSFSVQAVPPGLEFCGSGISGLFAQRRNILNPRFWSLLKQINRFNQQAPEVLEKNEYETVSLEDYTREKAFTRDLLDLYLLPMSSAVWSTPSDQMLTFPIVTLVRFFKNHGFLGLNTQHAWRTVTGGSRAYCRLIAERFKSRIRLQKAAVSVRRATDSVTVTDANGASEQYDAVVLASHADESLRLLSDPTSEESSLLGAFVYQKNVATLHTDSSVMPQTRSAWSSWNYRTAPAPDGTAKPSTIYWMNSLQRVSKKQNYFVSINDPGWVHPDSILHTISYEHPIYTAATIAAQKQLPSLNTGRTFFCGSYFRYGFHEDALVSAIQAVDALKTAVPA